MEKTRALLAGAILSLVVSNAKAAVFDFAYSGGGVSGSGSLTATLIAPGEYAAVSGTDNVVGGGVSGLLTLYVNPISPSEAYSPSGYFIYDNLVFPGTDPLVDHGGLLFTNGTGGEVNVYTDGPDNYIHYDNTGFNTRISFNLTLDPPAAVPEPAGIALLSASLAGVALARRKRAPKELSGLFAGRGAEA